MQITHTGSAIEAMVCHFLELNALRCITKNYHCRLGEIDLIMFDEANNMLVFVEVRFRTAATFGSATETVDWAKQRKLKRAVLHYLQRNTEAKQQARIDVIGVCNRHADGTGTPPDSFNPYGVSTHQHDGYLLRWTRNAIED